MKIALNTVNGLSDRSSDSAPPCSVIMRCKNSAHEMGLALTALFSQEYTDFELLVIDSGSTDNTLDIVSAFPHRLIRISPQEYVPGRVLNRGISENSSPICVFLNSSVIFRYLLNVLSFLCPTISLIAF